MPFVSVVGFENLIHLGRVHVSGHFGQWGGSIVTKPNLWRRLTAFTRDIFYDGLAPSIWALGGIATVALAMAIVRRDRLRALLWQPVLLVLAPYALWAFFAQNIIEQPRHVLPLVEGMLLLLSMVLAESKVAPGAVFVLMLFISIRLAVERHRIATCRRASRRLAGDPSARRQHACRRHALGAFLSSRGRANLGKGAAGRSTAVPGA